MKRSMMKGVLLLSLALSLSGAAAEEEEPGLLFRSGFDAFSVKADYAAGNAESPDFKEGLQLRMFTGVGGKGNALCLTTGEKCQYLLKDNIDTRQGTVSLWVSPQNWKASKEKFQIFFNLTAPKLRMMIYKYNTPNLIGFYLKFDDAPGKEKSFFACAKIEDSDWTPGRWHRLDAVWNSREMKFYVDGVLPPSAALPKRIPTKSHIPFPQELSLPQAESGTFEIGTPAYMGDKEDRTAIDGLKIYNRCLGAEEIRSGFEEYYPTDFDKNLKPALLTIPKTSSSPSLDGSLDEKKWSGSAMAPMANPYQTRLYSKGRFYAMYDSKYLYFGFLTDRVCDKNDMTSPDSAVYNDDCWELFLQCPDGRDRWICVNANGTVFDALDRDKSWNGDILARAVNRGKEGTTLELAIPLSSLGNPKAGDELKASIGFLDFIGASHAYFSWFRRDPKDRGILKFGETSAACRLECAEDPSNGKAVLSLRSIAVPPDGKITGQASRRHPDGTSAVFPFDGTRTDWSETLPEGPVILSASAKDASGKELLRWEHYNVVKRPLELSFRCLPGKGLLEIGVEAGNMGESVLRNLEKTPLPVELSLIDGTGGVLTERKVSLRKPNEFFRIPLPELKPGTILIRADIRAEGKLFRREIPFRVPDMTPLLEKTADDHTVPSPWTPIQSDGNGKYSVLLREYEFGKGPFPEKIRVEGESVLQESPALFLDSGETRWGKTRLGTNHGDYAELSGEGTNGSLKIAWKGELWFDGAYILTLEVSPEKDTETIRAFSLKWSMPEEFSRYLVTNKTNNVSQEWKDSFDRELHTYRGETLLWQTGVRKGLLWWTESDANHVIRKGTLPVHLRRKNGSVETTVEIINTPAELTRKAVYRMVFEATPARIPPKGFREFRLGSYQVTPEQNACVTGWTTWHPGPADEDQTNPVSHTPRDPARFAAAMTAWQNGKHSAAFPYNMPAVIGNNEPEYDYFITEWRKHPSRSERGVKDGVSWEYLQCCGSTAITDLRAKQTETLCKEFGDKGFGGIYYDICDPDLCESTEHGCGGIDAFGRSYFSSNVLHLRRYLMRIYKVLHKYDKALINHAHNYFNPIAHSFTDYWYPGENTHDGIGKNPEHFYAEDITPYEYQCAWNPAVKGVGIQILSQYGRAASNIPELKARRKEFFGEEYAIRTIAPMIVHDVQIPHGCIDVRTVDRWWKTVEGLRLSEAEFHGYWYSNLVVSENPGVKASCYTWKSGNPGEWKVLIVACNFSREAGKAGLSLDGKALGLTGENRYFDLWNGKELKEGDLKDLVMPSNHFLAIGVK